MAAHSEIQGEADADGASWNLETHIAMIFGEICEKTERKAEFTAARAQLRRALEMMSSADSDAEELRAELKALQTSALHTAQTADKAAMSMTEEREAWSKRLRTAQRFATELAAEANEASIQHTEVLTRLEEQPTSRSTHTLF